MTVTKNIHGYYEYNFMRKGVRYHRSFKGLSYEDVKELEIALKSELIRGRYDISKRKVYRLSDIFAMYEEYSLAHHSRPNERGYVFKWFLKIVGNKEADKVTCSDFTKYINSRKGKVKNSTINRDIETLRRAFSLALDENMITQHPYKNYKPLGIDNPTERVLTKKEEIKLLKECNPIMRAIVITALHTGMRQNEILSLKWQDVFLDKGYIKILNTKNNKPRIALITPTLKKELLKIKKNFEVLLGHKPNPEDLKKYVFTSPVSGTKYVNIKKTYARTVKRAKIPHITFHQLRHTFASRLNEKGVDVFTIKKLLGHSEVKITEAYTHINDANIINAFEKINNY